jgi:hypothetical protein
MGWQLALLAWDSLWEEVLKIMWLNEKEVGLETGYLHGLYIHKFTPSLAAVHFLMLEPFSGADVSITHTGMPLIYLQSPWATS